MRANSLKDSALRWLFLVVVIGALGSIISARMQNDNDDWQKVGTLKQQEKAYTIYYSPSRTFHKNGLVRAWFKAIYPEGDTASIGLTLVQFNCQTGKYRLLQQSTFYRNGGGTGSIKPTEWQYPYPESVPEMQYRFICRQAASAKTRG